MQPSKRQLELVQLLQRLDPGKRHRLTITCRGCEPWEVMEHVEETRLLPPPPPEGERRREDVKAA